MSLQRGRQIVVTFRIYFHSTHCFALRIDERSTLVSSIKNRSFPFLLCLVSYIFDKIDDNTISPLGGAHEETQSEEKAIQMCQSLSPVFTADT